MTGDTCPECGQALPAPYAEDCMCGHSKATHRHRNEQKGTGPLTACTHVVCGCELYRPLEVPGAQ